MKSGKPLSLLSIAAAMLGMGGTHKARSAGASSLGKVLRLSPPPKEPRLPTWAEMNRATHRIPSFNQLKARRARRARFAAGDRKAFR